MSVFRVGASADTSTLLRAAGAHDWSFDAVDAHKRDFEAQERLRDMPELWQRLHAMHPLLARHALHAIYAAIAAAAFLALVLTHGGWVTHMAGLKLGGPVVALAILGLWLQNRLAPPALYVYYWESLLPSQYVERFGKLPPQISEVMRNVRMLFPDCVFRIEVLGKDPILWVDGLGFGEVSRPLRVFELDGTHILPPR